MSKYLIAPREGKSIWLGAPGQSMGVDFKLYSEDTGGQFAIVEHPIAPGTLVPPHTHTREDEFSFVLEGEIGARIGDEVVLATSGCYVLKPRGIQHAFWNAGPNHARLIEIISPSGFERYFEEFDRMVSSGPPDMEAIGKVAARYGLSFSMEWVPELVEKYNLKWPPE